MSSISFLVTFRFLFLGWIISPRPFFSWLFRAKTIVAMKILMSIKWKKSFIIPLGCRSCCVSRASAVFAVNLSGSGIFTSRSADAGAKVEGFSSIETCPGWVFDKVCVWQQNQQGWNDCNTVVYFVDYHELGDARKGLFVDVFQFQRDYIEPRGYCDERQKKA